MLIVCPQCESRYEIGNDLVQGEGRAVRCTRCRAEWQIHAPPPEAEIEGPLVDEAPAEPPSEAEEAGGAKVLHGVPDLDALQHRAAPEAAEAIGHADVETAAARKADRRRRKARRAPRPHLSPSALRTLALVAGIAVIALAVQFRTSVVRAFPASASLFAHAGLPVNLRGLEFSGVKTSAAIEGNAPVLVVDGEIRNITGKPVPVPGLRLSIRDDKGVEIYGWTTTLARSSLEPGAAMPFKSRLASPPQEGRAVAVRFVGPEDKVAMK